MRIDPATLLRISKDFFARYDATQDRMVRADLAFEAMGMLRAFLQSYEDEEEKERRQYEATAHMPDEEDDPF
jgi:hypothetical protein